MDLQTMDQPAEVQQTVEHQTIHPNTAEAHGENSNTERHKIKRSRRLWIALFLFVILIWIWSWLPVTEHLSVDLPRVDTDPVRIALITDLHSCYYGKDQSWLMKRIETQHPDLVILGGDFFDDKIGDDNAIETLRQLSARYPVYYVTGNHEFWSGRAEEMKDTVRSFDVPVLAGDCQTLTVGDATLDICGVDDPTDMDLAVWRSQLQSAYDQTSDSHIKILVSHRPEKVASYERVDFDLILTGHAHAGQFYIPFLGKGLYAPDQGLMADYVNGLYTLKNGSIMEVSRGLARESMPLPRLFNRPELVILDIH